jgi:hypothetical protein
MSYPALWAREAKVNPDSGFWKDGVRAWGSVNYVIGDATTPDAFSLTYGAELSARDAVITSVEGSAEVDALAQVSNFFSSYLKSNGSVSITAPAPPPLHDPAIESVQAWFTVHKAMVIGGVIRSTWVSTTTLVPGGSPYTWTPPTSAPDEWWGWGYGVDYSAYVPHGQDPAFSYTLSGGIASGSPTAPPPAPVPEGAGTVAAGIVWAGLLLSRRGRLR